MSARTIGQYTKAKAARAKADKPARFVGCTCSNPLCRTTWIVCEIPQTLKRLTTLTSWHKQCPCCGTPDPTIATIEQIRLLLTPEE